MKTHVEEDRTRSRLTYAKKEGVERSEERRNDGKLIGGRDKMERSFKQGEGERWEDDMRERDEAPRDREEVGGRGG